MKGFKAFGKGMKCRGKQYAENTVFEEDNAEICVSGMHFCKNPLDVLDYYPLVDNDGEFVEVAEVEALDDCKTDDNKKYCTKKLKVGVKLSFTAFIKAAIDFVFEKCESGDKGDSAQLANSGDSAKLASSGYSAKLASSGYSAQLASSGYSAQLASSGDYAKLASSGYSAKLASSGDYAKLASSGDYAQLASSGYYAQLASSGNSAVIAGIGKDNKAKGKKGSWITLAEWKWSSEKGRWIPVCVKTEQIDGERIKEDTFYRLHDGEFEEC